MNRIVESLYKSVGLTESIGKVRDEFMEIKAQYNISDEEALNMLLDYVTDDTLLYLIDDIKECADDFLLDNMELD